MDRRWQRHAKPLCCCTGLDAAYFGLAANAKPFEPPSRLIGWCMNMYGMVGYASRLRQERVCKKLMLNWAVARQICISHSKHVHFVDS